MLKQLPIHVLIIPSALVSWFFLGTLLNFQAKALPGQSTEEVASWIKAHPTLRPGSGEQFFVQKSDTAAQRFTFLASVLPPGKVEIPNNRSIIRSERLAMYDAINGMTFERLEKSLRVIYGLEIYQDFDRAQVIYQYPSQSTINRARFAKTPIKEALRGELRVGDRYAYWVEVAKPRDGKAYTGQMTVLLKTDVDKLEEELQSR
ncbi:hypothetical protein G7B40_029560 [Aetokthonos hydrillicola Thurmond2011]|jgi:hypothetical protein|uniref:Uncharacterized protein n=1 Tax=Aetokthonos hydrillicola Thurmond2011 TaxID=2712845 RepID=A0AAP5IE45_9CYAN|nr:hypothetical protein [Aetokthonos hydrillicola]MBO3462519.1 hypothetical protein [Aetokthonos hydrillicola CCALA 1050]MBW4591304.1 hypothetical protein [Aetokthonos hydrillicola CCALA 1050]MDR9898674.1 hypothetical protein [Aetokthonos hydrillicola Thurmond2011]